MPSETTWVVCAPRPRISVCVTLMGEKRLRRDVYAWSDPVAEGVPVDVVEDGGVGRRSALAETRNRDRWEGRGRPGAVCTEVIADRGRGVGRWNGGLMLGAG